MWRWWHYKIKSHSKIGISDYKSHDSHGYYEYCSCGDTHYFETWHYEMDIR